MKPKPDLQTIRRITRILDEQPPVEIRKLPPWYLRPLNLLWMIFLLIALVIYLAGRP